MKAEAKAYRKRCWLCASATKVEEHHIDWHHDHNDPSNRVWLCQRCHSILHKAGYVSGDELDTIKQKVMERREKEHEEQ